MNDIKPESRQVSSIICYVHTNLSSLIKNILFEIGIPYVLAEPGRMVRQFRQKRSFGLPGTLERLNDAPAEVFQFIVSNEDEESVVNTIVQRAELDVPGRGSIISRKIEDFSDEPLPQLANLNKAVSTRELIKKLSIITGILSIPGSSELIAKKALELGTCVPLITLGVGTGIRDYLGLLRITVPADKEIIQLVAPDQDADYIMRILIDEGRLNRPGRGFLYRTRGGKGLLDTSLTLGRQKHAATMEQVIAALDDLKKSTAWRKRFFSLPGSINEGIGILNGKNKEITVICAEGAAGKITRKAMEAGAGGATISRLIRLTGDSSENDYSALERCIINTNQDCTNEVLRTLYAEKKSYKPFLLHSADSPTVYSFR